MNPEGGSRRPAIPRTVWALGFVSLFMDISSEIIHGLLPLFLTTVLGASVALVGLIDGIAEATASISKVFSGYVSDRVGRRKPLILLGYGLGAASKPLFALAVGPIPILGARFVDRIGKGLRGAPRDALVADVTPPDIRGRAYGLRQSLDTVGAFAGPLAAVGLMALFANDMRSVFWVAAIPGFVAVLLVLFGIEEGKEAIQAQPHVPVTVKDLRGLDRSFWAVVGIGIALLIGGVVVTESVYAIPGLGRLTVDAVLARDYPVIQAMILLTSGIYVAVNLLIDLAYTLLDPRIRY